MKTLVAYKPDSVDTCRGCVMERFSSDFNIHQCETDTALLTEISKYLFYNKLKEHGEARWELKVVDGDLLFDSENGVIERDFIAEAYPEAQKLFTAHEEKVNKTKLEAIIAQQKAIEDDEKKTLARLQKKYDEQHPS